MNIQHMKYAVEIARTGSINKASRRLLVAQPNLSRSVKDLEASLGIKIFDRSPQGMVLTPAGEEFIGYATRILSQLERLKTFIKTASRFGTVFRSPSPAPATSRKRLSILPGAWIRARSRSSIWRATPAWPSRTSPPEIPILVSSVMRSTTKCTTTRTWKKKALSDASSETSITSAS
ncbi:MAG: LysR family transcriptional regulator [Firmicutes bacterium]|nr:LysR family transcriptional regulator [Bacillota bacterium]